jgi:hypothetical protein
MKKYKIIGLIFCFLFMVEMIDAQINIGGLPHGFDKNLKIKSRHSNGNAIVTTPPLDLDKIKEEDKSYNAKEKMPRIGYPIDVNYDLTNSGEWLDLENGDRLWRLIISSPSATFMYLTYGKFYLPQGATFYIYDSSQTKHLGGFTSQNNKGSREKPGKFATSIIKTDKIILEYYEPKIAKNQGIISISKVIFGYNLDAGTSLSGFGTQGCAVNVNCIEGINWQNEKKSVMLIIRDGSPCSGALINNTNNNDIPYVLTANHILGNKDAVLDPDASDWLFYWNYESADCSNGNSFAPQVTVGATVISNGYSDFALLQLIEDPLYSTPHIPVFYSGWDKSQTQTSGGVGIHHPYGDIKKISTYSAAPSLNLDFWYVNWISTINGYSIVRGGCSGAPLYNNNHRIIGQENYHDGDYCNDTQTAYYGAICRSWNGSTNDRRRRLKDWLDPKNQGTTSTMNGSYCQTSVTDSNKTYISDITIKSCTIKATNIIIPTGINIIYNAGNYVQLNGPFQVDLGASLEIK